jgi:hypothetical protein
VPIGACPHGTLGDFFTRFRAGILLLAVSRLPVLLLVFLRIPFRLLLHLLLLLLFCAIFVGGNGAL